MFGGFFEAIGEFLNFCGFHGEDSSPQYGALGSAAALLNKSFPWKGPSLLDNLRFQQDGRDLHKVRACGDGVRLLISGSRKEMACLHGSEKRGTLSEQASFAPRL